MLFLAGDTGAQFPLKLAHQGAQLVQRPVQLSVTEGKLLFGLEGIEIPLLLLFAAGLIHAAVHAGSAFPNLLPLGRDQRIGESVSRFDAGKQGLCFIIHGRDAMGIGKNRGLWVCVQFFLPHFPRPPLLVSCAFPAG